MRIAPALVALVVLLGAGEIGAQVAKSPVKTAPKLPTPALFQDTIVISQFDLTRVQTSYQLKAQFLGLAPVSYRVSVFQDFRDTRGFIAWPASNVPVWQTEQSSGTCGTNAVKVVGFFQVQAKRSSGKRVNSAVARDSVCITFG
jgi:hypothetical protein